ncbi:MAG TPA: type II toxin-antitoxin system VapC family toxin [Solirubrobacteraceae bacterium]|jgi:PIN domain nuclease of toxin-antitoxin system|nr:type II toxin-antitoxin system VapC family toxin [Solirubrobacteraceae bacterium]
MPDAGTQPVLDASALLAYLGNETGADVVADAIAGGAIISTVNLGEALSTLAARGSDPADVTSSLTDRGLLDGAITLEPFTTADAIEVARLRPLTYSAGLSLADRACLALAHRLSTPVLTADHAWTGLTVDVDIRPIRDRAK